VEELQVAYETLALNVPDDKPTTGVRS
jgi:hypothetical protein